MTNEKGFDRDLLIRVVGLRREYPTPAEPLVVLDGVDMELGRGGSMAIMGPSGSGKSTLLHILGALDRPTAGSVSVDGQDPFALGPAEVAAFRNRKIGFVFQDHHLLPQCTVLENALIPTLVGDGAGDAAEKRALELLERVGLKGRLEHRPAELSGGERQRVAVCRALINGPVALLCDEPTGNLDRKSSDAIGELFAQIQKEDGTSLVVVTHSAEFAERFEERRRLVDGKLV
jgi:lipoprotein-releasing system ATP-binding protein